MDNNEIYDRRFFGAYATHVQKIKYQNLLHATLIYDKYSTKEFFEIIESEGLDIDPDSLVDGTDETFNNDFDRNLVKLAKERLYPYREQAMGEVANISATPKSERQLKKEAKEPISEKIGDFLFSLYDAPRRMSCGMKPFDVELNIKENIKEFKNPVEKIKSLKNKKVESPEDQKTEEENTEESQDETIDVEIIDKDGNSITVETEKDPVKQIEQKKIYYPVPGIVSHDIQIHFDNIMGYIKDRVPKGTVVEVEHNRTENAFKATVKFSPNKENIFLVDACEYLPDYYSIFVPTKEYGTIAVPFTDQIASKIINTPSYVLTKKDIVNILKKYYLEDLGLYYIFDFSNLKDMNKLSEKNKKKLSKILVQVAEDLKDKNLEETPRFRFSKFNSIDDFEITSDYMTKSPLANIDETSSWIVNTTYSVEKGEVKQKVNDSVSQQQVA